MNGLHSEALIRLGCFAAALLLLALAEALAPRRRWAQSKPLRWSSNLGLVAINTLAARLILPAGAVGMAIVAEEHGWGLLNYVRLPGWLAVVLAVAALDLVLYMQHRAMHAVPVLWRLHRVHHADQDLDVTSGVRFHTLEIVVSLGIKVAAVLLLGAPALAVLVFEVVLNATALFGHSNVRLPAWADRFLRLMVVTPDMHRVHHSVDPRETNSNYGFNLPWWDVLCRTYRAQPALGHEEMTIGLAAYRDGHQTGRLSWMLLLPFLGQAGPARGDEQPGTTRRDLASHTPSAEVARR